MFAASPTSVWSISVSRAPSTAMLELLAASITMFIPSRSRLVSCVLISKSLWSCGQANKQTKWVYQTHRYADCQTGGPKGCAIVGKSALECAAVSVHRSSNVHGAETKTNYQLFSAKLRCGERSSGWHLLLPEESALGNPARIGELVVHSPRELV